MTCRVCRRRVGAVLPDCGLAVCPLRVVLIEKRQAVGSSVEVLDAARRLALDEVVAVARSGLR